MTMGEDYGQTYFLTQQMEAYLDVVEDVAAKADLRAWIHQWRIFMCYQSTQQVGDR